MIMKNLVIWGAGISGEEVYKLLENHRRYHAVAYGDNNIQLWGKEKNGIPILNSTQISNITEVDGIVIASQYEKEIMSQLSQIVSVPIYQNIGELMCTEAVIDISGICNAKCKWCVTGRKNREQGSSHQTARFISISDFIKLYTHLYNNSIIEKGTNIALFSWGEPLLNKDCVKIIEYLSLQDQRYSLSTNASVIQLTEKNDAYKNCDSICFSMPGFSQKSYDRMHGFQIENITSNISKLLYNMRKHGFKGQASISYHVYKFNRDEMELAKQFAESLDLEFNPYYPYFNGYSMTEEYLENRQSEIIKQEVEKDLYLEHVNSLIKQRPSDFRCYLESTISIDACTNLVLCCGSDEGTKDYFWGSIYNISSFAQMRQIRSKMSQSSSCQKCKKLGMDYWWLHNLRYN